jgi:hypothetical protein
MKALPTKPINTEPPVRSPTGHQTKTRGQTINARTKLFTDAAVPC